ncbi:YggN family protein [Shewanella sp. YIC-542]|uniref:YggN family protein n=1 Tax=Shewanella mytili TaxID=3377111 RepID=UPI00398EE7C3
MKKLMLGMTLGCALLTPVFSATAVALKSPNNACDVSLNYDVTLTPEQLVVGSKGQEHYRIEMEHLYVDGKEVPLNAAQKKLLTEYHQGVAEQMPEVIALVDDALIMANDGVTAALTPLLGDDAGSKLDAMMGQLRERINKTVYHKQDTYFIGATGSDVDEAFNEEFSQQVEELMMQSVGSILMNVGQSMMNGDGNFSERMEAFGERMEQIGDEIEKKMEARSDAIEQRADRLCDNFQQLLVVEQQLREQVPALAAYPLVSRHTDDD